MSSIRPELVAAKLKSARMREDPQLDDQIQEQPRLVEMLWFLQWMFTRPGGGEQFTRTFVERYADRLGTAEAVRIGAPAGGSWSLEQCQRIWNDSEGSQCRGWFHANSEFPEWYHLNVEPRDVDLMLAVEEGGPLFFNPPSRSVLQSGVRRFNRAFFMSHWRDEARGKLTQYLRSFCEDVGVPLVGPSYFHDLVPTLLLEMDRHAAEVEKGIVSTEVARIIFEELDFSWNKIVPVQIVGNSRCGKTTSARTWCEMWPGRGRLVPVPPTQDMRRFYAAIAEAFGYFHTETTPTNHLAAAVEFIWKESRLLCAFDESQWLLPESSSKTPAPARLNWVRCMGMDQGLRCAFFATPQSHRESVSKYVKRTGYRMEQVLGRVAPVKELPAKVSQADLMAIAKHHFPGIGPSSLRAIVSAAQTSGGFIKVIGQTADYAMHLADRGGRQEPDADDLQRAIERMTPTATHPVHPVHAAERPVQVKNTAAAKPLQAVCAAPRSRVDLGDLGTDLPTRKLDSEQDLAVRRPLPVPA